MRPDVLAESLVVAVKGLLGPLVTRVSTLERTGMEIDALISLVTNLKMRMDELEAQAPESGPPGPPGPAGSDGAPGLNGKDGAPGLSYCGVYVRGKEYDTGEIVTAGGSAFHCNRLTTAAPGSSGDWTLMVKRGQDGKDGGRP